MAGDDEGDAVVPDCAADRARGDGFARFLRDLFRDLAVSHRFAEGDREKDLLHAPEKRGALFKGKGRRKIGRFPRKIDAEPFLRLHKDGKRAPFGMGRKSRAEIFLPVEPKARQFFPVACERDAAEGRGKCIAVTHGNVS